METQLSRRHFVPAIAGAAGLSAFAVSRRARAQYASSAGEMYPTTDPELVSAIVGASHGNIDRVRELLAIDPQLALVTWDWGFGDWESALGAASHTGRKEIAHMLMEHGARPNLFTFAMLDHVDAVRAMCEAMMGVQSTLGPHGITLLSHARAGDAARVQEYLEQLGGADPQSESIELTDEQKAIYLGVYAYGSEAHERFTCSTNSRGWLGIAGPSGAFRVIRTKGDHTFTPAGAARLKITFDVTDGKAQRLTVHHNAGPVVAERIAE